MHTSTSSGAAAAENLRASETSSRDGRGRLSLCRPQMGLGKNELLEQACKQVIGFLFAMYPRIAICVSEADFRGLIWLIEPRGMVVDCKSRQDSHPCLWNAWTKQCAALGAEPSHHKEVTDAKPETYRI